MWIGGEQAWKQNEMEEAVTVTFKDRGVGHFQGQRCGWSQLEQQEQQWREVAVGPVKLLNVEQDGEESLGINEFCGLGLGRWEHW